MLHLELGRATAVPLATPAPAKLGHDPKYLRVIDQPELRDNVGFVHVGIMHIVAMTNQSQYSAPPLSALIEQQMYK